MKHEKSIFAQRLTETRQANGWSQMELAEKIDVSQNSIYEWETDKHTPRLDKVIALVKEFEVSADWLLGLDWEEER